MWDVVNNVANLVKNTWRFAFFWWHGSYGHKKRWSCACLRCFSSFSHRGGAVYKVRGQVAVWDWCFCRWAVAGRNKRVRVAAVVVVKGRVHPAESV